MYPDRDGFVERDGVKVGFEVYGSGPTTVVLVPTGAIVHSRAWKAQIPYLARFYRVVAIDPRGNGRSDRPRDPTAYADTELVADTLAVMDEVGVDRAVLVGLCASVWPAAVLAAESPHRVAAIFSLSAWMPHLTPLDPHRSAAPWDEPLERYEGWNKQNKHYWQRDWRDFAEFFFDQMLPEPHSTKQWEDCVGWALETDVQAMIADAEAPLCVSDRAGVEAVLRRISCPVLAVHGAADRCQPRRRSELFAELTGGRFLGLEGAGHLPQAREPVLVNHLLREFVDGLDPRHRAPASWTRPLNRPRKLLMVSSPIGLGHARRDVAIAEELHRLRPDVQVDWLAQAPVSDVVAARGGNVHPASAHLASEVDHVESESSEHDLHAFQAIRRMDEILVANFMVFDELVRSEHYDAWVADEGWDVDYFLHENPELKSSPYLWLTDFVGWLPMPDGGEPERRLTTDYNAEMVEQIERFPRLRDRSVFVGDPEDCVPDGLGDGLPSIRDWTESHFDFAGYVTGYEPLTDDERLEVRASLGWAEDEKVVVVAVGGTSVGAPLLRRAVAAYPAAVAATPGLRMVVVAGPRIDPDVAGRTGRRGGARLRPRPLPPARRERPGRRAGRPHDLHGAGGQPQAVPVRPPAPPLRADLPRPSPAVPLRGRPPAGLRRDRARAARRRDRRRGREARVVRGGRHRRGGARGPAHRRTALSTRRRRRLLRCVQLAPRQATGLIRHYRATLNRRSCRDQCSDPLRRRCFEGLFDEGVDHPLLEGADFSGRESGDVAQPDAGLDATCGAECQREPVEALLPDRLGDGRERLKEPRNDAALAQRQLVRHLAQREPQHRTLLRLILLHEADDEPGNGGHAFVQRFRRRVGKDRRGSCLRECRGEKLGL